MKFMKKLIGVATAAAIGASMTTSMLVGGSVASAADMTAIELVEDMGLGWNLGNSFDSNGVTGWAPDIETGWGNVKTTETMITTIKESGFNTVRIPITWYEKLDSNNKIDETYLARIKEVVDYCTKNGMYAIINIHHDGVKSGWLGAGVSAKDKFVTVWEQIAEYFKDYDEHLVFESMNEVEISNTDIMTLNQAFVDTVRAVGGENADRLLLVPASSNNTSKALSSDFSAPDDSAKMVAVSVHYYEPTTFCVCEADASWGPPQETWGTSSDYTILENDFNKLEKKFIDSGVPVIIGEYGVLTDEKNKKDKDSIHKFLRAVASTAYEKTGMCPVLWDTSDSGDMNFFSRKNLSWYDSGVQQIYADISGMNPPIPGTTVTTQSSTEEPVGNVWIAGQAGTNQFWDIDSEGQSPVVITGNGSYTASYLATDATASIEAMLLETDINAYAYAPEGTSDPLNDSGIEISIDEILVDGKPISYTGPTDGAYRLGDNGSTLRYNILNEWTSPKITDIEKETTVERIIEVKFTISGLPVTAETTASSSESTTTTTTSTTATTEPIGDPIGNIWIAGQAGTNSFWDVDSEGQIPAVIVGNGSYTASYLAPEATASIEAMLLETDINSYAYAPEGTSDPLKECGIVITIDEILVDGKPIAYQGPTDGAYRLGDNGSTLRYNILNEWTSPKIADIEKETTIERIVEVKFTVSGLPSGGGEITTASSEETTTTVETTTTAEETTTTVEETTTESETTTTTVETTTTTAATTTTTTIYTGPTDALFGDANLDGSVDLSDVVLLNKIVSGSVQVSSEEQRTNCDVNVDGAVSADDSMAVLQFLVHLIPALPV